MAFEMLQMEEMPSPASSPQIPPPPFFKLNYIYRAPIYNNSHLMKIPPPVFLFFFLPQEKTQAQTDRGQEI